MNRRQFLFRTATAVALVSLLSAVPASRVRPFFAFDNGVGRGAGWVPARQADLLTRLGFDGIGYTGMANFAERRRAFHERGQRIFNLYVAAYVDRAEPFEAGLLASLPQLAGTGADLWLTLQGRANDDRRALEIVAHLADLARAQGVRVALYPHKGFHVATAEHALRLVRAAARPNVGVTLNLCHELAAGHADRLDAIVAACAPQLFFVSINGADRDGANWDQLIRPLDEGTFDLAHFLAVLDRTGYVGPIGLQCYNLPGDPEQNLARSIAVWRRLTR